MQIYETLLLIAGVATALTTISVFIGKIVKKAKKCINFFKGLQTQIDTIEKHCKENYMRELQIIIMSEEMPIEERLRAGEEYVNNGGNGAVKAKYRVILQRYEEEHEHEEKKA